MNTTSKQTATTRESASEFELTARVIVREVLKQKNISVNGSMRKHVTTWGILLEPYIAALSGKYGKSIFSDKAVIDYCRMPRENKAILDVYPELRDMVPTIKECAQWMKKEFTKSKIALA